MADMVKISELPVATTSAAADSIPIVQGGVTKQIHPGAGGGLAADSVPNYGIGITPTPLLANIGTQGANDCSSNLPGLFRYALPSGTKPSANGYGHIIQFISDGTFACQIANDNGGGLYYRSKASSVWGVWQCLSDGLNAGQPPAPKPRTGSSDSDIGRSRQISGTDNTAVVLPAGGTWHVTSRWIAATSGNALYQITYTDSTNVYAGGSTIIAAYSGYRGVANIVRIA